MSLLRTLTGKVATSGPTQVEACLSPPPPSQQPPPPIPCRLRGGPQACVTTAESLAGPTVPFADDQTQAQRSDVTCPMSHSPLLGGPNHAPDRDAGLNVPSCPPPLPEHILALFQANRDVRPRAKRTQEWRSGTHGQETGTPGDGGDTTGPRPLPSPAPQLSPASGHHCPGSPPARRGLCGWERGRGQAVISSGARRPAASPDPEDEILARRTEGCISPGSGLALSGGGDGAQAVPLRT